MLHIAAGLARSYSPLRSGPLPQVSSRAISGSAKLVAQTLLPMSSFGTACSRTAGSAPMARMTSIVRWLVMCARGEFAVPGYLVIVMAATPWSASSPAIVRPAGPAPTTSTSVSVVSCAIGGPLVSTPVWCAHSGTQKSHKQ